MAGTGLLIFAVRSTENVLVKHLTIHMAYVFYKFHVCFDLSVLKNQTHSTYVWRRKVVKAQREDYVVIQWQFYIFKTGGATFENVNSRHNWGASQ